MINLILISMKRLLGFLTLSPLILLTPASLKGEWVEVWSDEFDVEGAPDPSKWGYDLGGGGWGNGEAQIYTDSRDNSRVENGNLVIEVRQTFGNRVPGYTSARLITREKMALQYGRIEVRAKMPSETGTWSAIWMLSNDTLLPGAFWPDNGEIDIMEHVGYEEDPLFLQVQGVERLDNIHSTLHTDFRNGTDNQGIGESIFVEDAASEFKTYVMDWGPNEIVTYIDGIQIARFQKFVNMGVPTRNPPDDTSRWWPFIQRFYLILNVAVGGEWGGHFNSSYYPSDSPYGTDGIDHDGVWPQQMLVDYVRVYRPADELVAREIPGDLHPQEYISESGFLLENSDQTESSLNYASADIGDEVSYRVNAAASGTYQIFAEFAGNRGGSFLELTNATTGVSLDLTATATGGELQWQTQQVGEIDLLIGENILQLKAIDEDFRFGTLSLSAEPAGDWNGMPVDVNQVVQTSDWVGPVNVAYFPTIFVPRTNSWFYVFGSEQNSLQTTSQWLYAYSPRNLREWDSSNAPWYYSKSLGRWFYAPAFEAEANLPQWIYLLN